MEKQLLDYEIDNTDIQLLNILQTNAFTPFTEIAKELYVSPGTVHVRMKKLTDAGIAKAPQIQIDLPKMGYDITAFIGVYLNKSDIYESVVKALKKIPEIVSCHYTTGNYSLFLKIHCRDTQHLRTVLHEKIQKIEGINRTETLISLEESFVRNLELPLKKTQHKK
ncbi:MAG: Lrp/AsnC ligand binding domain-containing protein [Chitinophagales bacterium]|nr:Lrp/AsnC ligand binding domain-containing protein [Chitinophagales bacterium]MCO5280302.1 Lrp/AsnC ligand binding domain-containing protein [Chitinophagales bacterium]OJV26450.1 MAG: transcriptional regulator AsnC [Bacteroidetes bacterium 37-13]HRN93687.1 Lrp/AsnC ligand binding domain-containing protein [Chitinophagales bacterium]HRP39469.1 Lrp/AsnC ligand binding domain-containing protein [Chitinophagales bacterium]